MSTVLRPSAPIVPVAPEARRAPMAAPKAPPRVRVAPRAPDAAVAPAPVAVATATDTIEDGPTRRGNAGAKTLLGFGVCTLVTTAIAVGTVLGVRAQRHHAKALGTAGTVPVVPPIQSTPVGTDPRYNNTGLTMVQAYNKAFHTAYENSQAGFATLKQQALGDFTTPQLFAQYACSGAQANTSCTLAQALQGNSQQVNLPLVIADEDLRQRSVSLTAVCDSGSITTAQSFVAPLPPVMAGNGSRGFFSVLNSPDAACVSTSGTPLYNFHYTLSAGNQTVGANNSLVLFRRNGEGPVTNALIGVNQGDRSDALFFNAPIYNLQTSY